MIYAILPAHNESRSIASAIRAVAPQVDEVIVMSDNSTDDTVKVAREAIVSTGSNGRAVETVNNSARKAGALNQALAMLPLTDDDMVLCMDADTVLSDEWVVNALNALDEAQADAAGAVFGADRSDTWVTKMQAMEWARYGEQIGRTGKTFVLSGTAALIRFSALRRVMEAYGHYYREDAICEDFQLTVDLLRTGATLTSPASLTVKTETMPTVKDLFLQRRRWSLGALQVCKRSGLNSKTRCYWRQQTLLMIGIVALWAYIALTVYGVARVGFTWSPFWSAIGLVFVAERVSTVWDDGLRSRIIAASIAPELVYAILLQVAHAAAVYQFITGSKGTWHHVTN